MGEYLRFSSLQTLPSGRSIGHYVRRKTRSSVNRSRSPPAGRFPPAVDTLGIGIKACALPDHGMSQPKKRGGSGTAAIKTITVANTCPQAAFCGVTLCRDISSECSNLDIRQKLAEPSPRDPSLRNAQKCGSNRCAPYACLDLIRRQFVCLAFPVGSTRRFLPAEGTAPSRLLMRPIRCLARFVPIRAQPTLFFFSSKRHQTL
jgi:hypothetical protein